MRSPAGCSPPAAASASAPSPCTPTRRRRPACGRGRRAGAAARAPTVPGRRAADRGRAAAGADAIHPGYGFLSENADSPPPCIDAGLTWIGPPVAAVAAMGSKIEAKKMMAAAGVPVLDELDPDTVTADQLPVLIKASAGGGGRGMRVVREFRRAPRQVEAARREAQSAFGDPTVFCERYLATGHHVEVQVLADEHGTVWAVGERECSIQRRHQKIIEEAPSPLVERIPGMRAKLFDAARLAAGRDRLHRCRCFVHGQSAFNSAGWGECELLWAQKLSGNRFGAPPRRPWQPVDGGVAAHHKAEAPGGEPAADQKRATEAHNRAHNDVAGKMRVHHHPAYGDYQRKNPHGKTRLWPKRADRDSGGESIGGMPGRQAGIGSLPHERVDRNKDR